MSIKCQNFSPKIQLWKNWPFVRESNGVLFSNTHQTVVRWPWHDMISFFYSFLVVEKSCKVFLFKSWHGKKIAWGSSKQMIHTVCVWRALAPSYMVWVYWNFTSFLQWFSYFLFLCENCFRKERRQISVTQSKPRGYLGSYLAIR